MIKNPLSTIVHDYNTDYTCYWHDMWYVIWIQPKKIRKSERFTYHDESHLPNLMHGGIRKLKHSEGFAIDSKKQ